ncbi:MAG: TIGR03067 domain-containing protein [Planctomycetes bacterium]|nr:TIGR03067 domain-containing protein [Planctomycetota bacterium]MBL7040355.1 TIGR03067 domain-containing protein [Pirellulaceae bacterium]
MTVLRMLVTLLVGLPFAGFIQAEGDNQGKHELQGSWDLQRIVLDGKPFPVQVKEVKFIFSKDRLTIVPPDENAESFPRQTLSFTLHPETNPKSIDTTNLDGSTKGMTLAGIYKIEGDSLTVCIATESGAARPKSFESKEGSKLAVYTLQRAKPQSEQQPEHPESSR